MRKRKYAPPRHLLRLWIFMLSLGFCSLVLISVWAMWEWVAAEQAAPDLQNWPTPGVVIYPTIQPSAPQPVSIQTMGDIQNILLHDHRLIISNAQDEMFSSTPGLPFQSVPLQGGDVAGSGQMLAYVRDSRLYVYDGHVQKAIPLNGTAMMPAWNASGSMLYVVVRQPAGDSIYRIPRASWEPEWMFTVQEINAPPRSNPATGRLLIVARTGPKVTTFYTIDSACTGQTTCEASRRDLATIQQPVNWASYHPNAATIVFSDTDTGSLYLLHTGNRSIEPVATGSGFKRRPVVSRDGRWLVYINVSAASRLELLFLDTGTVYPVEKFFAVASIDWLD